MVNCGVCNKIIPESKMKKDPMSFNNLMGDVMGDFGVDFKKMPNVMDELAMKCDRCGVWICSKCAANVALSAGAGSITHSGCGGWFKTP